MPNSNLTRRITGYVGKEHPYAANRFVSIVRKMFNVGRQLGLVPEHIRNPATEIVPFPEKKRRRYVTLAERCHCWRPQSMKMPMNSPDTPCGCSF